jgi:hypothetical protein
LQSLLRTRAKWCSIKAVEVLDSLPFGANSMMRSAQGAGQRCRSIATAWGSIVLAAAALLVFSVSVLSSEVRILSPQQNTSPWHTSKSSRMAEVRGDDLTPILADEVRPALPALTIQPVFHFVSIPLEAPLREFLGVPKSHGLRAPPII